MDPTELQRLRDKLVALENIRDSGLLSVQHDGRRLTYQTGADLRAAIADLKRDIDAGVPVIRKRRTFRFTQTGTGLN